MSIKRMMIRRFGKMVMMMMSSGPKRAKKLPQSVPAGRSVLLEGGRVAWSAGI